MLLALMISLNLWASILFGWLFWRYGLLAAMLAHSIFHLLWVSLEMLHLRMAGGKEKDSGGERKIIQDPLRGET
jgi:hypothetical protein